MKKIITLFLIMALGKSLSCQISSVSNQEVSPKIGINALAIKYFGIEFTKEQRSSIENIEIEFVYEVDTIGKPILSEVNGIKNQEIIDSLKNKTNEIGLFNPRILNGKAESSIYFMKLTFPSYKITKSNFGLLQGSAYNEAKLEDFEYLLESGNRIDVLFGGVVNKFLGNPSNHLKTGGGMKMDISYAGRNNILYGLNMSFYGNKLKNDYPISSTREQFNVPPTLLVGLVFGKWYPKFNIQGEVNLAVQNLTERLNNTDSDWVQLKGWSPGIVLNYPIRIGKQKTKYYYGSPSLFENNLNFHFGIRYLKLSITQATGVMTELGVSYRMTVKNVKEYKLKDEYLNR